MISIIIPTLNEEKYLPKLLDSIKSQTYKDYEVIVADGNSKDRTAKIAESYGCRLVYEQKGKKGHPGIARNLGARVARGDYYLFFDADVVLPSTFIEKAFNEFEERYLDVATTNFLPLSRRRMDKVLSGLANNVVSAVQYVYPHGWGFCILCTKRMFNRIEGFDEELKMAEDHDFIIRCTKVGGKFRLLKSTKFRVSLRRVDKEGVASLARKYAISEWHMLFKGRVTEELFEYEFGKFGEISKKQKKTLLKKEISYLTKKLKSVEKKYKGLLGK